MPLIALLAKEPEMLQPDAFCKHTMQQNVTAARAPFRTLLWEITALQNPLTGFKGGRFMVQRGGRKGKRRERGRRSREGKEREESRGFHFIARKLLC